MSLKSDQLEILMSVYLPGVFYSPQTADAIFFDSLNKNIQKASDITNTIIILVDMNEDLLNPNIHNLKDVLLLNSLHNMIPEPTRKLALCSWRHVTSESRDYSSAKWNKWPLCYLCAYTIWIPITWYFY